MLNGVTFVLFGAILLGPALGELSWELVLYAVLSLTVVRMLPVVIAMLGSRAQRADARLPRLVRSPRPGVDRVRGDRRRGVQPSPRAPDRARDLRHRGALGPRSRPQRGPARRPLRPLVRAHPRDEAPPMESAPADVTRARPDFMPIRVMPGALGRAASLVNAARVRRIRKETACPTDPCFSTPRSTTRSPTRRPTTRRCSTCTPWARSGPSTRR